MFRSLLPPTCPLRTKYLRRGPIWIGPFPRQEFRAHIAKEKDMTAEAKHIEVTIGSEGATATMGDVKIEVSPASDVVVYTNDAIQTRPKAPATVFTKEGVDDMQ